MNKTKNGKNILLGLVGDMYCVVYSFPLLSGVDERI